MFNDKDDFKLGLLIGSTGLLILEIVIYTGYLILKSIIGLLI